jgi:small-conductance mechanosensitive channel
MSPRTVGILAMVGAFALAVFGGLMFSNPCTAILGALMIGAASILFAIGAVWTLKKSWDDKSWPPDVTMGGAKALKRQRRIAIVTCMFAPLIIGAAIAEMVIDQGIWPGAILLVLCILSLLSGIGTLRSITHPPKDTFWMP